jgi:hypothetical protein
VDEQRRLVLIRANAERGDGSIHLVEVRLDINVQPAADLVLPGVVRLDLAAAPEIRVTHRQPNSRLCGLHRLGRD